MSAAADGDAAAEPEKLRAGTKPARAADPACDDPEEDPETREPTPSSVGTD